MSWKTQKFVETPVSDTELFTSYTYRFGKSKNWIYLRPNPRIWSLNIDWYQSVFFLSIGPFQCSLNIEKPELPRKAVRYGECPMWLWRIANSRLFSCFFSHMPSKPCPTKPTWMNYAE